MLRRYVAGALASAYTAAVGLLFIRHVAPSASQLGSPVLSPGYALDQRSHVTTQLDHPRRWPRKVRGLLSIAIYAKDGYPQL